MGRYQPAGGGVEIAGRVLRNRAGRGGPLAQPQPPQQQQQQQQPRNNNNFNIRRNPALTPPPRPPAPGPRLGIEDRLVLPALEGNQRRGGGGGLDEGLRALGLPELIPLRYDVNQLPVLRQQLVGEPMGEVRGGRRRAYRGRR